MEQTIIPVGARGVRWGPVGSFPFQLSSRTLHILSHCCVFSPPAGLRRPRLQWPDRTYSMHKTEGAWYVLQRNHMCLSIKNSCSPWNWRETNGFPWKEECRVQASVMERRLGFQQHKTFFFSLWNTVSSKEKRLICPLLWIASWWHSRLNFKRALL